MKNQKGQALIEFVILLPIIIMIIFIIIDFGIVIYEKNKLENVSTDIVNMYENTKNIDESLFNNIDIEILERNDYIEINISKDLELLTPGIKRTRLSTITTKRIIYEK